MRFPNINFFLGRVFSNGPSTLTKFNDDEPDKVSVLVDRLVRELMMGKKIPGTKAWILIAQIQDGRWVGYYCFGVGNNGHKKLALEWSGSLSAHIRFHLLGRGFNNAGINNLIKGRFNLQATKEAAQAVVGEDGCVKSIRQGEAEQILLNHDKTRHWVDLTLSMTKKQQEEYERERAAQAKQAENADQGYNFNDTHSVNPVAGQPEDCTTFTITGNQSLGETAYGVVMVGSDDSDLEEFAADLYKDENGGANSMDLDIDQVHQDAGNELQEQRNVPEDGAGTASKELQMTSTRQSGSNEGFSLSTNGSGSGSSGHTGYLSTDLAKTSLNTNEGMLEQGQENDLTGVESLAQAKE